EQAWLASFVAEVQPYGEHPLLTHYHLLAQVAARFTEPPPRLQLIGQALRLPLGSSRGGWPLASAAVIYMHEFIGELLGAPAYEAFDQWRQGHIRRVKAALKAVVRELAEAQEFRDENQRMQRRQLTVQGEPVYEAEPPVYTYEYDRCVHFVVRLAVRTAAGQEQTPRFEYSMNGHERS